MKKIAICDWENGDVRYMIRTMLLAKLFCRIRGYRIMEAGEDYIYAVIDMAA